MDGQNDLVYGGGTDGIWVIDGANQTVLNSTPYVSLSVAFDTPADAFYCGVGDGVAVIDGSDDAYGGLVLLPADTLTVTLDPLDDSLYTVQGAQGYLEYFKLL